MSRILSLVQPKLTVSQFYNSGTSGVLYSFLDLSKVTQGSKNENIKKQLQPSAKNVYAWKRTGSIMQHLTQEAYASGSFKVSWMKKEIFLDTLFLLLPESQKLHSVERRIRRTLRLSLPSKGVLPRHEQVPARDVQDNERITDRRLTCPAMGQNKKT